MLRLVLAGLYGTRESADDLIAESSLPADLAGETVAVFCRDLLSGSTSFADQLVVTIVVKRNADALVIVGAPERFKIHLTQAAERRNVAALIRCESAADLASR